MKGKRYILALVLLLPYYMAGVKAQTLAIKSDLLTGALSSPNLAVEMKLSERLTLEAGLHYNPFPAGSGKRWKHWFLQPELRYWMCRPWGGHFFGAHLIYGVYNVGNIKLPLGLLKPARSARYEGELMGVGVAYGYNFILSPRWSLETSVGVGLVHTTNERYRGTDYVGSGSGNAIVPTRMAVSLVYLLQ